MTELALEVRLKADGSGLIGQLRLSEAEVAKLNTALGVTGTQAASAGAAATAAAGDVQQLGGAAATAGTAAREMGRDATVAGQAVREMGGASGAAGAAARQLAADQRQAGTATSSYQSDLARLRAELDPAGEAQRRMAREVDLAETAYRRGDLSLDQYTAALARADAAGRGNVRTLGQQRAGFFSMGQQVQDIGIQLSMGTGLMQVMAMQGGQLATAIDMIGPKGAGGRAAAFFAAPWGSILLAAAAVLTPVITALLDMNEAQEKATVGANALGAAQTALGEIFDLTTGKIKSQNELLILNARLTAINMRADSLRQQRSAAETFGQAGSAARLPGVQQFQALGIGGMAYGAIAGSTRGQQNAAKLSSIARRVESGQLSSEQALRLSESADFKDVRITRAAFQQAIIDRVSSEANKRVADLIDQSLDDKQLAAGLRRTPAPKRDRQPPKPKSQEPLQEFGRDAADRIAAIEDQFDGTPPLVRATTGAISRLNDLMDDLARKKPPGFQQLIAEAERVKLIVQSGIARPFAEFVEAQEQSYQIGQLVLSGDLARADALRAIVQLERQMGPLTAEQKDAVLGTVQALHAQERQLDRLRQKQQIYLNVLGDVRGIIQQTIYEGPESLEDLPGRLYDSFKRFQAEIITERLFGDTFEQLKDEVLGANTVQDASDRMVGAVDQAARSIGKLGQAAEKAAGAVAGAGQPAPGAQADAQSDDIVVTGRRDPFARSIEKLASSLGIGDKTASLIGNTAGKAMAGAFEGQAAAGVASLFGVKTSNTGAAIGGAIGNFLPLPPGVGSLVGGLAGGIIGGLFKTTKTGSATIGDATSKASLGGNNAAIQKEAGGLASSVQQGLQRIAEQLGGSLGSFGTITIGKRGDDFRVNTGGASLKTKKGAQDFGDDAEAAIGFAITTAIARGAVEGLSAAVQSALKSSPDLDRALQEAVKVGDLEKMLGGLTGQLQAIFRDAERLAAERVGLARKHGLDILAVEKLNAEQRAKLLEDTLASRIGSLQDVLDDLNFGDLFEGSASEQLKRLGEQVAAAQADIEAGKDGAGDRLAELLRRRLDVAKGTFGTGDPEYAEAQRTAREALAQAIKIETDRVNAAAALQQAQLTAAETGNQIAEAGYAAVVGLLGDIHSGLSGGGGGGGVQPQLSLVERLV